IVFDVNETLLDLSVMLPAFTDTFGDKSALKHWFMHLLQYSLVDTLTDNYHHFDVIGKAVLDMTAQAYQTRLTEAQKDDLIGLLQRLPPHPEVPEALRALRDAGFALFTLTNSPQKLLENQIQHATLQDYFTELLSIEGTARFKPHPDTYQRAQEHLSKSASDIRFVAAHAWDIAGAASVGWKTAFIARNGIPQYSLSQSADIQGASLKEVAQQIMAQDH
ncbi:MAG: haloacid dehalogenase type II, partial [Bacteroidota bacterium]